MKTQVYINYGVLCGEYRDIFTVTPHHHAAVSEKVFVDIPDELVTGATPTGEPMISPKDCDWSAPLSELLGSFDDKPVLSYINRNGNERRITLPKLIYKVYCRDGRSIKPMSRSYHSESEATSRCEELKREMMLAGEILRAYHTTVDAIWIK